MNRLGLDTGLYMVDTGLHMVDSGLDAGHRYRVYRQTSLCLQSPIQMKNPQVHEFAIVKDVNEFRQMDYCATLVGKVQRGHLVRKHLVRKNQITSPISQTKTHAHHTVSYNHAAKKRRLQS